MEEMQTSPLPKEAEIVEDAPSTEQVPGDFPWAMEQVIDGKKITRLEWADKDVYGLLKDGYLMIHREEVDHQWIVNDGDLNSIDWITV
jgi:hypothetical protein